MQLEEEDEKLWLQFVTTLQEMDSIYSIPDFRGLLVPQTILYPLIHEKDFSKMLGVTNPSAATMLTESNMLKESAAVLQLPTPNNDKPHEYLNFVPLRIEIQGMHQSPLAC